VWEDVPKDFPNFRKEQRRQLDKQAKKRKAEEMG
jgi:chlorophyllide a reductase subunit Y